MASALPLRCALARLPLRALLSGLLVASLGAGPARSASVVEVRVGRHPTFTRVVFELDSPSGYRVERQEGAGGLTTFVVTLEASSQSRTIASKSPLLASVSVEGQKGRSVARIRLRQGGLRLKEMILAGPPRIVLDVMSPEAEAQSLSGRDLDPPAVTARAPAPATEAPRPPAPAPAAPRAAPPAPAHAAPPRAPAPGPVAQPEVAAPLGSGAAPARPADEAPEATEALPPLEESPLAQGPVPAAPPPRAAPAPEAPRRSTAPPAASARPEATAVARPSGPFGLPVDTTVLGAAAAGVLAVVLVTLLALRRRRPRDGDGFGAEPLSGEPGASPFEAFRSGEAGDGYGGLESGSDATRGPGGRAERAPFADSAVSLFDDDEDKGEDAMQRMETQAGAATAMDAGLPMARGAVRGDSDLSRVVSELERRLAQAEARLDETVETCERLERQVAAQSEELRVQRAAIARTQRALRSLSRTEEEQATEPALREPR